MFCLLLYSGLVRVIQSPMNFTDFFPLQIVGKTIPLLESSIQEEGVREGFFTLY